MIERVISIGKRPVWKIQYSQESPLARRNLSPMPLGIKPNLTFDDFGS
jgi:hypothetical protein